MNAGWYEELLRRDLDWVRRAGSLVKQYPLARRFLERAVHHRPSRDLVTLSAWACFGFSCLWHGFPALWTAAANLCAAWVSRWFFAAPRPFMFDPLLRPKTDRYRTSFGFPSVETHMATVLYGFLAWHADTPEAYALAFILITLTGFTRVYSYSRFVHQVAASFLTGLVGLSISLAVGSSVRAHMRHHSIGLAIAVFVSMGILGMWIESNDCTFAGIERKEFTRVLRDILAGTPAQGPEGGLGQELEDGGSDSEEESYTHADGDAVDRRRASLLQKRAGKKDSFYFLHKTMEIRSAEAREIRARVSHSKRRQYAAQKTRL